MVIYEEGTYCQSKLEDVHVGDGGRTLSNGSSEYGGEEQSSGSSSELHNYGGVVDDKDVNEGCFSVKEACVMWDERKSVEGKEKKVPM